MTLESPWASADLLGQPNENALGASDVAEPIHVFVQRSVKHYVPVLEAISGANRRLWEIDVDGYDDEAIGLILSGAQEIRKSFPHPARDVLVTKIMLGVFGCVPAFDRYFKDGFGSQSFGQGPASYWRVL
jgi:hypothetical protein